MDVSYAFHKFIGGNIGHEASLLQCKDSRIALEERQGSKPIA